MTVIGRRGVRRRSVLAALFGHGDCVSRGIDVDAAQATFQAKSPAPDATGTIDILGKATPQPGKPVVCVVHGDTWNLGHEIYLACDDRIAAANTDFGQDEKSDHRVGPLVSGANLRLWRVAVDQNSSAARISLVRRAGAMACQLR